MRLRSLLAVVIMAAMGTVGVQAPAYAAEPFTFTVTKTEPRAEYVIVHFKLTNTTGERVELTYKRLPDGAVSRQLTLYPEGRSASESEDVHLPCSATSTLEFTYSVADGPESKLTHKVATPACAVATSAPGATVRPTSDGDNDVGHIDMGKEFLDMLKRLGITVVVIVLILLVLLVIYILRVRRR